MNIYLPIQINNYLLEQKHKILDFTLLIDLRLE